ncbi:MAG: hypothetical protein DI571_09195 [Arsenicicoccus sp.]|uniref:hypothetical protein n=1 Tax=Serinicoccus profundi TaxID=1078471 RepID=UPI000255ED20|nr:hypothetical protein [Serinicoccus profundi]PZU43353.1 MAG: hypothetical protein DI571_09195 [Arsenicicoccus sp.]
METFDPPTSLTEHRGWNPDDLAGRRPQDRPPSYPATVWGPPGHHHPRGTHAFVLGLLSVTVFTPIGPFAWAMARRALQEVDAAPVRVINRGQLAAAQVMGVIATVLLAFVALTMVAVVLGVLLLDL